MPTFTKSNRKNKKYMVVYNGKKIHFGDTRYSQYRDSVSLKLYSHLDHKDKKRQERYLKRAKGIKNAKGEYTHLDPESPNYYSIKYLWN